MRRDDFTATVDGAAGYERERALNTLDYDQPYRPSLAECERDEAEMSPGGQLVTGHPSAAALPARESAEVSS